MTATTIGRMKKMVRRRVVRVRMRGRSSSSPALGVKPRAGRGVAQGRRPAGGVRAAGFGAGGGGAKAAATSLMFCYMMTAAMLVVGRKRPGRMANRIILGTFMHFVTTSDTVQGGICTTCCNKRYGTLLVSSCMT